MKKPGHTYIPLSGFLLVIHSLLIFSQQAPASLTVRDIMAEPSIAGMRVEGEKLSPDGRWVAYLWSAAGKDPRDLYLVSTTGGPPRLLVRAVNSAVKPGADQGGATDKTGNSGQNREQQEGRDTQRDSAQQAREQSIGGIDWSADSRRVLYSKSGDVYVVEIKDGSAPRRLTQTMSPETAPRWLPDSRHILYQSGGSLFVMDADQTSVIQLTREGGAAAAAGGRSESSGAAAQSGAMQTGASNIAITGAKVSNNGSRVAYVVSDTSKQRGLLVTDYTGEFVTTQTVKRGWSDQRLQVVLTDGSTQRALVIKLPTPEGVSYIRGFDWSADDTVLVIDRIDQDLKRRQMFRADIAGTSGRTAAEVTAVRISSETDPKWIAPLSRLFELSPKDGRLFITSERDGYNLLYLQSLLSREETGREGQELGHFDGALSKSTKVDSRPAPSGSITGTPWEAEPLTGGRWEINWAKWLPDGEHIIYSSTEASTAERHFYVLDMKTRGKTQIEFETGMNTDPQLSRDGKTLLFSHSEWNRPNDLFVMQVCTECKGNSPRQLTETVPARFTQINWTKPEFVAFTAKDGKTVKGRVYTPAGFNRAKKYPAVVFVHGAGYLQNVINGWNNYYREALFNNLLTQRGYVVLDIDYRGSAGYGRDWRTDVYDFLGGLDLQDHLDGIDFIVKSYAVDPNRVGMYGGSYGGFMAEMAAMRAPEHIACAAALRPVADWKNYYASSPVYTAERLGFPDKNTEGYKRSSPITYADKLSRPLLIFHGMVDDNVHFQDSVQLTQKLIELGKTDYFDVMFYPKESHSFTRPDSWTDEYERLLRFFDTHLKP